MLYEYALRTVATRGVAAIEAIRQQTRESPVVHADETGWREDGQNRYVWVLATPKARYFEIGRLNIAQIDSMLGNSFGGILVTDFYSVYNHFLGEHQRCWAHLLRDVRELVAQYLQDRSLARWARRLDRLSVALSAEDWSRELLDSAIHSSTPMRPSVRTATASSDPSTTSSPSSSTQKFLLPTMRPNVLCAR